MKRIDLHYGGKSYSIGNRDMGNVREEIDLALASGKPYWLEVNQGSGALREAHILIMAGVEIALVPRDLPDADEFVKSQDGAAEIIASVEMH